MGDDPSDPPEPYACDVHFASGAGVPLAWMWSMNANGGIEGEAVCRSSCDETSAVDLLESVSADVLLDDLWSPSTGSAAPLPRASWSPYEQYALRQLQTSAECDTDGD